MAQLVILLNGRSYTIGCADGEEDRLKGLAVELDRRTAALVDEVGQVGDTRLLVMLGLLLLDEVEEARAGGRRVTGDTAANTADMLDALAERIEALADRVERA